jgi:hypothetical protein
VTIANGLWIFLLGALAVPNIILSRRPDARRILDKITPYQGWIGLISAVWGILQIIALINALTWLRLGVRGLLEFILFAAFVVTQMSLGFILGIGVIKHFIKDVKAQAKMDEVLARIIPYQAKLGVVAMLAGIAIIVDCLVF